jgi:hypothetical protein
VSMPDAPNPDEGPDRYARSEHGTDLPPAFNDHMCGIVSMTSGQVCQWTVGHNGDSHSWGNRDADKVMALAVAEMPPLLVVDDDGHTIFKINGDGTAELPDPDRAGEAARIFWSEVTKVAQSMGWRVRWVQDAGPAWGLNP